MKIKIEFIGFPQIYNLFQEEFSEFNFYGNTLPELINALIEHNEIQLKESLWDSRLERLDPTVQIMINNKLISKDKISEETIKEGDVVTLMRLLAGG